MTDAPTTSDEHDGGTWPRARYPITNLAGETVDMVNHPPHYGKHPSGIECIDVVEHMSFNLGNAVKYIWRADEKGNTRQDLEKAVWYINREIIKRGLG